MRSFKVVMLLVVMLQLSFGQFEQKQTNIQRVIKEPKIDGVLDETEWNGLPTLDNFVQYAPYNGEPSTEKSEVKVGYDDNALYIGARFYDNEPEKITRRISRRDNFENDITDCISLIISPYDDQNNAVSFVVTASGVQKDRKLTPEGIDKSWDAVWQSSTKIVEDGWIAELRIPYSALRFSTANVQNWGFNVWRNTSKSSEWSTWSYASNEKGDFFNYYGMLNGFEEIKPPARLSVMPYVSSYLENTVDGKTETRYNAGMDLKYGINESFTLDAILIPDFGQVQSDDQELNLSPYEIRYNEKRQFFTEGTELFSKGNIFYSRRIGKRPAGYYSVEDQLNDDEEISENPVETKLINAVKVSGRTKNGLGVGVFNAMTSKSEAIVKNMVTGKKRNIETQGFTNYNLVVFDKLIATNSYISMINTNVSRNDFVANVTATEFKFSDKNNNNWLNGKGVVSYRKPGDEEETGYAVGLDAGRVNGNFVYNYDLSIKSDKYNPNDMGYLRRNNEIINQLRFDYNINKPFDNFLNLRQYISFNSTRLYDPNKFAEFYISYQISTMLKNQNYFEMHALWRPMDEIDYYEARSQGRKLNTGKGFHNCFTYMSDTRKDFSVWVHGGFYIAYDYITNYDSWDIMMEPRWRINDRTSIIWFPYAGIRRNTVGYVSSDDDGIFMGERDVKTIENTFSFNYMVRKNVALALRTRHYWSEANYDNYYSLKDNGDLEINSDYSEDHDINYNALTIDASLTWNFLPGSEMSLVWKNNIYTSDEKIDESYFKNLSEVIDAPQSNSISLKILYYLDYLSLGF